MSCKSLDIYKSWSTLVLFDLTLLLIVFPFCSCLIFFFKPIFAIIGVIYLLFWLKLSPIVSTRVAVSKSSRYDIVSTVYSLLTPVLYRNKLSSGCWPPISVTLAPGPMVRRRSLLLYCSFFSALGVSECFRYLVNYFALFLTMLAS